MQTEVREIAIGRAKSAAKLREKVELPEAKQEDQKKYVFGVRHDAPEEIQYVTICGISFQRSPEHPDNSLSENRDKPKKYATFKADFSLEQIGFITDRARLVNLKLRDRKTITADKVIFFADALGYEPPKYIEITKTSAEKIAEKLMEEQVKKSEAEQKKVSAEMVKQQAKGKQ